MIGQTPVAIGVTGGIGSGKSSVVAFLAKRHQAPLISADDVCRQLVQPDHLGWQDLRRLLDAGFFHPDRTLNRVLLRERIFTDPGLRHKIEAVLHPLARQEINCFVENAKSNGARSVFVEVPLLYEAGWQGDFDSVIVVYADQKSCIRRIMARDKVGEIEAKSIIHAQWSLAEKALLADHVIDNSGSWVETCLQLLHLDTILTVQ